MTKYTLIYRNVIAAMRRPSRFPARLCLGRIKQPAAGAGYFTKGLEARLRFSDFGEPLRHQRMPAFKRSALAELMTFLSGEAGIP